MNRWITAGLALTLAAGTGVGGYLLGAREPAPQPVRAGVPGHEVPSWRTAAEAARADPAAAGLRSEVLEVINTANGDVALAEAVRLLGWVAQPEDHDLLLSFARSGDGVLEGPGLEALGRLGTDEAVTTLLALLQDRSVDRHAVIAALGHTGHADALDELVERLQHPDDAWVASWALAQFATPRAVHFLAKALRDADPSRAGALARALASMVDDVPEAADSLHGVLSGPRNPRRSAALAALAEAHDPLVYDVLMHDLDGPAPTAAQAALGLGTLGDPRAVAALSELAVSAQAQVRGAALDALSRLDHPEADAALIDIIATAPPTVAARAVMALPRADEPEVLEALLAAVADRPTDVRRAALQRLLGGTWPIGEVPEAVLELARIELRNPTANTWGVDPVGLLLQHGSLDDAQLVATALTEGPTPVRTAAVWSLQQLGTPGAQELLLRLADDTDPGVRQSALNALLDLGAEDDVERLILEHLAAGLQNYGSAEELLVRLGTPRAIDTVMARIETGTQREWSSAVSALAMSGSRAHSERLLTIADRTDDAALRSHILQSLSYSETVDLERVVKRALEEDNPQLHATAAYGLARMGTPDSREQLLGMTRSPHQTVASAALSSLGQLGGADAEAALVDALHDPELAWTAVSSLQQVGTPSAREALLRASADADSPQVRASIVQQLPWLGASDADARLDEAMGDEAPEVRFAAISALQGLGTTQAAEVLAEALSSGDLSDDEASQAALALQGMGGAVAQQHAELLEAYVPDGVLDTATQMLLPE